MSEKTTCASVACALVVLTLFRNSIRVNLFEPMARLLKPNVLLVALIVLINAPLLAAEVAPYPEDPYQADPREVALVPRYCIYTQLFRDRVPGGNNAGEVKRWTSLMGPIFHDMHHYCAGLMRVNRALLLLVGSRKMNLEASITEFDYVINRAPADFVLLPEVLTKKGESLLHLERATEGAAVLLRAIEVKSDYWPPYAALSDYFKKFKNVSMARDWLEKGLAASPDARALKQRLADLDAARPK